MSTGKRPDLAFSYKDKATGVRASCGVGWLNDYGGANIKPETKTTDGEYPTIPLVEALRKAEAGEGFLNLYATGKGNRLVIQSPDDEGF